MFSRFAVCGSDPSFNDITERTASRAGEAPRQWPVIGLIELRGTSDKPTT